MLGLITTIACLAGIRSLRCRRNAITCNLCLSLLLVNFIALVGLSRKEDQLTCRLMAMFLQYFLLSAFVWMLLEGYFLYQMIVVVFSKVLNIPMALFYAAGYGLPFVTVAVSFSVRSKDYGQGQYCWLSTDSDVKWSFLGPICFILLVNTTIFVIALKTASNARQKKAEKSNSYQPGWLKGSLSTMCLLGIPWILIFTNVNEKLDFMKYIFTILNGLQGLFIFIFHVVANTKNRETVVRTLKGHYIRRSWSRDTSSTRTHRTNQSMRSDRSSQKAEVKPEI